MGKLKNKFDDKAGVSKGTVRRFMNAVHEGKLASVERAVEKYPSAVNWRDSSGYTALHFAAGKGDTAIVSYLLDKGADINARTNDDGMWGGATPLFFASEWERNIVAVNLLLDRGADIGIKNERGENALTRAAWYSMYNVNKDDGHQVLRTLVLRGSDGIEAALKAASKVDPEPGAVIRKAAAEVKQAKQRPNSGLAR